MHNHKYNNNNNNNRFKEIIYKDKAKNLGSERKKMRELGAFKPKPGLSYDDVVSLSLFLSLSSLFHNLYIHINFIIIIIIIIYIYLLKAALMCHDDKLSTEHKLQLMLTLNRLEDLLEHEEKDQVWLGTGLATKLLLQVISYYIEKNP